MRNAFLSILLFFFTMLCVYMLNNSVINLCDHIKTQTESIELKITSGDFKAGYNESLILLNSIQEKNFVTSIYLSHQEFDNLLNEAVKLSTYLIYEDETEAHTSLHLLKHNTNHIKKLQLPNLENIL
ncbi:hypothetical protein CLPUN_25800 [Clostridium puniceum]|uniref:DUF4363 domain-containing protein n=1 Tax=Clostridium puniceum TaxID=29367 RepID=A0A1S8TGE8_9CLOT|nr:DUF4363 family protein [Clostridium puniceum]OOM76880.1 hypothetical protein CLPUN_25800 [Clostridium puniceum]